MSAAGSAARSRARRPAIPRYISRRSRERPLTRLLIVVVGALAALALAADQGQAGINAAFGSAQPAISILGPNPALVGQGSQYDDQGAVCADADDRAIPVFTNDTVDTRMPGTYDVVYVCSDGAGGVAVSARTVIVVADAVPPLIDLNGLAVVLHERGSKYADPGALCIDDVDGNKTLTADKRDVRPKKLGNYTITYSCSDSAGNEAEPATRTVVVVKARPAITLVGDPATTHAGGTPYADPGATCWDPIDGELPVKTGGKTITESTKPGTYTVKYSCADEGGHKAKKVTRTVTVTAP